MSTPSAKLLVSVSGKSACIKIVGRANFTSSIDFKTLLNELLAKGYECFRLYLAECVLMDSTFLGVLAGFGLKLSAARNGHGDEPGIELVGPNARITELLENLGVLHLFKIVNEETAIPDDAKEHVPDVATQPTREEITTNCLDAHRLLMEISPNNIPKFKEVAQFLAEDLKKIKAGS